MPLVGVLQTLARVSFIMTDIYSPAAGGIDDGLDPRIQVGHNNF